MILVWFKLGGANTEIMTIYNDGMEVLEISNIDFSSDNDGFTTNMTLFTIDAGGMYGFEVTFSPLGRWIIWEGNFCN